MKIISIFLVLLLPFFSSSCGLKPSKKWSVLLVAVENLGFEDLSCNTLMDSKLTGFKNICEDSVYFTHAYTPSTNSASTMASIFTGQYPHEHKLRGLSDYLQEESITIAEEMLTKKYKTSLFSSGGNIFRKKGIDQGFETFNDRVQVSHKKVYRSSAEINSLFKKWMDKRIKDKFFSVLHYSDPFFQNLKTTSNEGHERTLSRQSQIEELSESFDDLISYLKRNKIWDNTMVIFVGLNGASQKDNLIKYENLYSENMHIPLVIKPPRKKRDLGINWTIDKNVSLVDLGVLLRDFISVKLNPSVVNNETVSLVSSIDRPISDWNEDRLIFSESYWGEFYQTAVRSGSILYFNKENVEIYNSLIDRQEISSVGEESYLYKKINIKLSENNFISKNKWLDLSSERILNEFAKEFWLNKKEIDSWPVEFLIEESKKNKVFYNLFTHWLLKNNKIELLSSVNKKIKDEHINYIISQNGKSNSKNIKKINLNDCFTFALLKNRDKFFKQCKDELSMAFWSWDIETNKLKKQKKMRLLFKLYSKRMLSKKINIYNMAFGYPWFYMSKNKFSYHWFEKYVFLPENKALLKKLKGVIY